MTTDELDRVLTLHSLWLNGKEGGRRAFLEHADLQRADLRGKDLRYAYLVGANLYRADLKKADLRGANLQCANMSGANLNFVDLREAILSGADLDYCSFPLSCGTKGIVCDIRLIAQLAYHFCELIVPDEFKPYQDFLKPLAKRCHKYDSET